MGGTGVTAATYSPMQERLTWIYEGLIVIAIVVLLLAWIQHQQGMRALRADYGTMPRSIAGIMAVMIAGLGVIALLAVVLRT